MRSAYSRTRRSSSEKLQSERYLPRFAICSAEIPLALLTAEPMSIQNGHPTSVATRSWTSSFSLWLTSLLPICDRSIWIYPQKIFP